MEVVGCLVAPATTASGPYFGVRSMPFASHKVQIFLQGFCASFVFVYFL
jgi:hypothetical protein